jgi:hypothetical protein
MMSFCCYERVDHRIQQPSWTFQQRFDSSRQANGTGSILPGRQGIRRAHPQHGCESTNQWLNMAAKNLRSCLKDFNVED